MAFNKLNKLKNYERVAKWIQGKINDYFPDRSPNMAYIYYLYVKEDYPFGYMSESQLRNIYNAPIKQQQKYEEQRLQRNLFSDIEDADNDNDDNNIIN